MNNRRIESWMPKNSVEVALMMDQVRSEGDIDRVRANCSYRTNDDDYSVPRSKFGRDESMFATDHRTIERLLSLGCVRRTVRVKRGHSEVEYFGFYNPDTRWLTYRQAPDQNGRAKWDGVEVPRVAVLS